MFTGLKDLDREILRYISDAELPKFFVINKTFYFKVCDDNYLRRRLQKYTDIFKYKSKLETMKIFYSRAVCSILKMRQGYSFHYSEGNFYEQILLLQRHKGGNWSSLLTESCKLGDLSLVQYCISKNKYFECLRVAATNNHLNIMKYLIEKKYSKYTNDWEILRVACEKGYLEIVKYAVEVLKLDIHFQQEKALRWACACGRLEIVKYLVDHGALIHVKNFECIKFAKENKHHDVVDYLEFIKRKNLKIF